MNENDAYIFDVEEPKQWVFTGEPVWISGWFLSKVGAVFSDVRALIDGRPHLGILGLPRREIELQHRGYCGLPHAGFVLRVQPPRHARLITIELLDAGHRWVEIWRANISVRQGGSPRGHFHPGVLSRQMHRLLQAVRANPAANLFPLARELAAEAAAVPLDTLPNPPFFGALEIPGVVGGTQFGKLKLEGWLIHRERPIRRIIGSTHPLVENVLENLPQERKDAAEMFPDHPSAARSHFFGMLDIDETAPAPAIIKLFAELEDGTRHLVFARRFYPRACHVWERPLPAFNRPDFFRCARTLVSAAHAQDIHFSGWKKTWQAFAGAWRRFREDAPAVIPPAKAGIDPYQEWQQTNRLTPRLREKLSASAAQLAEAGPKITLLIDTRGATAAQLMALVASLEAQIYPKWEARPVGPTKFTPDDPRCLSPVDASGDDFLRALNAAAHQSQGVLLALLPGHSRLSPDALLEIAERFAANPNLELIYTDEDRMDDGGARSDPFFKPEWSPALALSGLFPGQLAVIRREKFVELGSFLPGTDRRPWQDVLLRLGDRLTESQVAHVPLVCHHAWSGAAHEVELSDPAHEQIRQSLAAAVARRGWNAQPFLPEFAHHRRVLCQQPRWSRDVLAKQPVTIVIPTRDKLHLLQECIELLDETVDWRYVKLVIVDDHSRDADAVSYLERIARRNDLLCIVVRPADPHAPFNYSRLVNAALPHIDTPLVLHLNNDVNALERGWLEEMAGWFTQPDVGVVGAKLVYPDKTLNHTGIVIGPHGGLADTPWTKMSGDEVDPVWHAVAREVSAVTGACLMTRSELYRELGGFDEKDFGVAYNDVDYCLRVRTTGRRVVYAPQAKLMHWGSATRGVTFNEAEHVAWLRRYPGYRDPYFSPHWQLEGARVRCAGAHFARPERAGHLRLLLLTHNLNLEGAPLFLLEYATHVARHEGFPIQVLSAQDGPLRSAYEALGASITVVDVHPLHASPDAGVFHQRLDDISRRLDWEQIDLVVCNTLVSFWGVPLARRAGRPSLFYVHESTSIFRFFEMSLARPLHSLIHAALREATRTLFLTPATRAYYEDDNQRGNFRLVPSWIRLDEISRFKAAHPRAEMRRKHGLRDDEIVIANIGTVCERKGQHIFIRAVDHFNHHHRGGPPVRFVMVGARQGIYLDLLQQDIALLDLKNIMLVPETREVFDFFVAADMFVCTSYEESFPRVVMEAMAFGTPIVSTNVHGIPDLIGQRQDGYLVNAGEVEGLSRMMRICLAKERSGKSLTATAYSKVLRFHDSTRILPRHADLAREAWLVHE